MTDGKMYKSATPPLIHIEQMTGQKTFYISFNSHLQTLPLRPEIIAYILKYFLWPIQVK